MTNEKICPEDVLRVLLPVGMIPQGATVSKRGGEQTFTLAHGLRVYPVREAKGLRPESADPQQAMTIDGFFLVSGLNINQVKEDLLVHWHVTTEDFVDTMQRSWEGTPQ